MNPLLLLLFLSLLQGDAPQTISYFQEGNGFFQKGYYEEAIAAYEKSMGTGYESAELYFNLGNAYFKTDRLGKSILFFERAKRLLPNDVDIAYNLELAQLRAVDKILTPPEFFLGKIWHGLVHLLSLNQWGAMALTLYLLTMVLIVLRLLWQKASFTRLSGYVLIPLVIVTLVSALFFFLSMNQSRSERGAIILADKAEIFSSPSADGTEVFALHEGTQVRLGESSGAFVRISLPDGKVGWIRRDALEEI